jgi:two-component system phosphate regulon response regulator PhoB
MANIYVIDDDYELLMMVGIMLRRAGHEATLIGDPVEGLARVLEEKPDLVIIDLMMPHMSGFDVCRAIRANDEVAKLPILILTARLQSRDRVTAYELGADDYLVKPITARQLTDRIDQLLLR